MRVEFKKRVRANMMLPDYLAERPVCNFLYEFWACSKGYHWFNLPNRRLCHYCFPRHRFPFFFRGLPTFNVWNRIARFGSLPILPRFPVPCPRIAERGYFSIQTAIFLGDKT